MSIRNCKFCEKITVKVCGSPYIYAVKLISFTYVKYDMKNGYSCIILLINN